MASNEGADTNGISLDEEELRRLLEQPGPEEDVAPQDVAPQGVAPQGVAPESEPTDDASPAPAEDDDLDDVAGSQSTAAQAPLGQDTIDQLLAQARGDVAKPEHPPVPSAARGSTATNGTQAAAQAAKREPRKEAARAEAAPVQPKPPVTVQPVQFSSLGAAPGRRDKNVLSDLGILLDVPLHITVELGRAEMPVREILALGPGSVIELDRSAGEVLDVLVNGTLVAQGEVVVVDEQFGIRLTHVFSPNKDILEGLGD